MSEPCVPVSVLRVLLAKWEWEDDPLYSVDLAALCDTAQPCANSEIGGPTESQRSQGAPRFTDADLAAYQRSGGRSDAL